MYKYLRVNNLVSVSQWAEVLTLHESAMIILLMGPSGAGKTHFIETLGGGESSDSRARSDFDIHEGHTQTISAFKLNNVEYTDCTDEDDDNPWDIFFIDTPGLSGSSISVMEIIESMREWMDCHGVMTIFRVVYFCPITGPGLSRRDRQAIETFKLMTGLACAESVVIATTKWDLVQGEGDQLRSEEYFEQIRDVWEDFIEGGACITRFHGTQTSALEVLDRILGARAGSYYHLEQMFDREMHVRDTPFALCVYGDLLNKVESFEQQLLVVEAYLPQLSIRADTDDACGQALRTKSQYIRTRLGVLQSHLEGFGVFSSSLEDIDTRASRYK